MTNHTSTKSDRKLLEQITANKETQARNSDRFKWNLVGLLIDVLYEQR